MNPLLPAERAPDARTAADLLRPHYIALAPGQTLGEAEALLGAARARCLPVVEAGRLVGVLTHRALHERFAEALRPVRDASAPRRRARLAAARERSVREAMAPPRATAARSTSLPELVRRLERTGTGCIAVLEPADGGDRILGLVTEADLLRAGRDPAFHRRSAWGTEESGGGPPQPGPSPEASGPIP